MQDQPNLLPTSVKPTHYNLTLNTDIDNFSFNGLIKINLVINESIDVIKFNTKHLEIQEADLHEDNTLSTIKVISINYDTEEQTCSLKLSENLKQGKNMILELKFSGILNRAMSGFYASSYESLEGKETFMASTHFEPSDARQAFPCWDEPALRATFDIKLIVKKELTALSNTSVKSQKEIDINGIKFNEVTFETTPNMSTYLIAFAVGDFDYIEDRTKEQNILTRVYAIRGSAHLGKFALDVACKSMDLYYKLFDQRYPISKLDLIAIPDFNIGAMENWGLVTFRTVCLLYEEGISSFDRCQKIANIVAHELAHQWFGNLVALEWWSQLWLKEGFATYIASYAVDKLFPEWDAWTDFVMDDYQRALKLDSLKSSHPIQVPVNDPKQIGQIFDAISYSKGASILRMLFSYLGEDNFFEGIRIYLNKYQYSNATTSELWQCLEQASNKPVSEFMDLWTNVAGYPLLSVKYHNNNQLLIEQSRFYSNNDTKDKDTTTLWWIPLLLNQSNSIEVLNEKQMILDIQLNQFIKFNNNSIGVYRVCYDEQCLLDLGKQIEFGSSLTDSDKIGLLSDVYHTAISGHLSITFYLNFVFKFKNEKNPLVLEQVAISLNNISSLFYKSSIEVQNGLNQLTASMFQPWAEKLGFNSEPSENPLLSTLRVTAISNFSKYANKEYIDSLLTLYHQLIQNQNPSVAKDLKPLLLKIAIRFGDEKEYQEIRTKFEIEKTMDQKLKALVALGSTSNKNLIQTSLNYSICNAVRPQDTLTLISALAINSKAREDTWKFVKQNWNLFEARYKQNVSTLGNIIKSTAGLLTSKEELEDIEKFFEGRDISAYKMALNNTIEQVKINSTFVTKANKDLEIWLKENGFQ